MWGKVHGVDNGDSSLQLHHGLPNDVRQCLTCLKLIELLSPMTECFPPSLSYSNDCTVYIWWECGHWDSTGWCYFWNPLDKHSMTSSSGSQPQWPNTVHNMYLGKPSLATAEDPFGTRLSGRSNRSNHRLQEKGTPVHGTESADALSHYKPKFSHRAQENVTKRHADKRNQPVRWLPNTAHNNNSHSQSKAFQRWWQWSWHKLSVRHASTLAWSTQWKTTWCVISQWSGYPWEMEVKLLSVSPGQSQPKASNGLGFGQVDSAKKVPGGSASLLPHRKARQNPYSQLSTWAPCMGLSLMMTLRNWASHDHITTRRNIACFMWMWITLSWCCIHLTNNTNNWRAASFSERSEACTFKMASRFTSWLKTDCI